VLLASLQYNWKLNSVRLVGIEFWLQRKTAYKFIERFAVDLLSSSSCMAGIIVERILSLRGLMTAGRRNRMKKTLEMREFLKLISQLKLSVSL